MVQRKVYRPEMHTTYLLKPGQTLKNTKPSKRSRALMVPGSTFQRFVDYTTETERIAAQQEKKAAEIAAMKKATYEKTKHWDSTIENIRARQREELLSKRRIADEERKMFVKEAMEKKAAEREEVVKQARELLLQKKPLYQRINGALLVSECLRELDVQVAFQKTIKEMVKEHDTEYANSIKLDVAKYEEQRRQMMEEQARKTKEYRMELKKQIEKNERESKAREAEELKIGKQEQKDIVQDMQLFKEKEMQDILDKRTRLQQFFKEAMKEKKQLELKLKQDEELEDQVLEVYRKAKDRIQKIHETLREKEKESRYSQHLAEGLYTTMQDREAREEEMLKKAVKEQEAAEAEKRQSRQEKEERMRALIENYKLEDAAVKIKREQAEKDLKSWEMMQRFKRDEYNKQAMLDEYKQQWQQKLEYRKDLQKNIEEKQNEKKREKLLEADVTQATIEKANKKLLLYGKEILEESKDVRPLYPILKVLNECKKEMGLVPTKRVEETEVSKERSRRKQGIRRACTKPVPDHEIHYLQ